jgi:tetratricopeptide (TPR) repeat protein
VPQLPSFNFRDRVEDFFSALEENRSLRLAALGSAAVLLLFVAAGWWLRPLWKERSSIRIARQWLAADKLDRADEAVRDMLARAPHRVEAWQLAAEYARRIGQKAKAAAYLHHAATLRPDDGELALDWIAAAILAGSVDDAEVGLVALSSGGHAASARAERLSGEIARVRDDLKLARDHFESAVRLGGAVAENEIPLGIVLVSATSAEERARGHQLLQHWRSDPQWGLDARRALLADALVRKDVALMPDLAAELLADRRAEDADVLNALLAFSKSDQARFAVVLEQVERSRATDVAKISELAAWLSGVGRGQEAVRWLRTLPPGWTDQPPVVVAHADALRVLGDWAALRELTQRGDWGEVDFLRQAYLVLVERNGGDADRAAQQWRGVRENARLNGGRALFLAGTLYTWGCSAEAIDLWWLAAEQPGVAVLALGSLARHYQVQRDAEGLYRAFRRLHEIKSDDLGIANNYAYFAALTGHNLPAVERIARENRERAPKEMSYVATHAFILFSDGRRDDALALLPEFHAAAKKSPSLAFTGGILLASVGRAPEARELLEKVEPRNLTLREEELLNAARAAAGLRQ